MEIAVIVASAGRPEEIKDLLGCLARQTKAPSVIVLSVTSLADVPDNIDPAVEIMIGERGLTKQRNRGIDVLINRSDVIVFYDDDFIPDRDSIAGIEALFSNHPNIVSATGAVLADGVKFGGIGFNEGFAIISAHENKPKAAPGFDEILWAYGCNMAFRSSAMNGLRFDEDLVMHGWQEDMDFAACIAKNGAVVKTDAFCGVHRGVNKGRSSGLPLGFAQVVNPIYLVRKGTMTYKKAAILVLRNVAANHGKILWPEPYIDRRGRVIGNWHGLLHILRGRADPKAVLEYH